MTQRTIPWFSIIRGGGTLMLSGTISRLASCTCSTEIGMHVRARLQIAMKDAMLGSGESELVVVQYAKFERALTNHVNGPSWRGNPSQGGRQSRNNPVSDLRIPAALTHSCSSA